MTTPTTRKHRKPLGNVSIEEDVVKQIAAIVDPSPRSAKLTRSKLVNALLKEGLKHKDEVLKTLVNP